MVCIGRTRLVVTRHVREGREHLNFSDWPQARPWDAKAKLESIAHELREDVMPPGSYLWLHAQARLTGQERQRLAGWAETNALTPRPQRAQP